MPDHARPLSTRGQAECVAVGAFLAANVPVPDVIFCSTAARTRETLSRVLTLQTGWPDAVFEAKLYLASPGELLHHLQTLPAETERVLLVGHNPGLQELALLLAAPVKGRDYETLELGLITGGLVTLETASPWAALSPGVAQLNAYCRTAQSLS